MIHVVATIEIVPGKRDQFLAALKRLIPLVRSEPGCVDYVPAVDVAADIPQQPALRPNRVVMHEKWQSMDAMKAHLAGPHLAEFTGQVQPLVAGLTLEVSQSV